MSQLVETMCVRDGRLLNALYHSERFNRTVKALFNNTIPVDLEKTITVPAYAKSGIFKCRVEYDEYIRKIEFTPYEPKEIRSLRFVEDDKIDYQYKFIQRDAINKLFEMRGEYDDIIIVRKGMITDSSYANIIALDKKGKWHTPTTCLLAGTQRAKLLMDGKVKVSVITPARLRNYREVRLINAMRGVDDSEGIATESILW